MGSDLSNSIVCIKLKGPNSHSAAVPARPRGHILDLIPVLVPVSVTITPNLRSYNLLFFTSFFKPLISILFLNLFIGTKRIFLLLISIRVRPVVDKGASPSGRSTQPMGPR